MSILRARIVALWAVLVALAPWALPAHARLFCRTMDRVVDACCCGHEKQQGVTEVRVQKPDCCERLSRVSVAPAAAPRELTARAAAPVLLATLSSCEGLEAPEGSCLAGTFAESRAGPLPRSRLFLDNCALLI